jgi:signal transduction histidine kinase
MPAMALMFLNQRVPGYTWPVLLRSLAWGAMVTVLIALGIAIVLTIVDGGRGWRIKLVYSLAISFCCWAIVDATRRVIVWTQLRRAQARGLPPPDRSPGWQMVLALVVLTVLIGPSAGLAIGDAITGIRSASIFDIGRNADIRTTMTMTAIGTSIGLVIWSVQTRLGRERLAAEQARKAALEQQLLLLQAQLEPHMLFNTLANLRVLIAVDPARAQAMLDRLIAFLRATLAASRSGRHALEQEFDRLADYLELMAVRMGPRLSVRFELPAELRGVPVPPLLLQPLVENAIRHGLEPKVAGGRIVVRAEQVGTGDATTLRLTVADTGVGLGSVPEPASQHPPAAGAEAPSRFGMQQVHERLAALYGTAGSFALRPAPEGDGTWAVVDLPMRPAVTTTPHPILHC